LIDGCLEQMQEIVSPTNPISNVGIVSLTNGTLLAIQAMVSDSYPTFERDVAEYDCHCHCYDLAASSIDKMRISMNRQSIGFAANDKMAASVIDCEWAIANVAEVIEYCIVMKLSSWQIELK
jgi:hypothetical protein